MVEYPSQSQVPHFIFPLVVYLGYECRVRSLKQVDIEGTELLRMCKKVQCATPGDRGAFIAESGDGRIRLPDHFPHFLPNPEARPSVCAVYTAVAQCRPAGTGSRKQAHSS